MFVLWILGNWQARKRHPDVILRFPLLIPMPDYTRT
jgi:hypothetical protein